MNLSDLRSLIASGESSTLELKKSTAEKERACRTLCAFANGEGGQLIFGVTPAGKIVGQAVSDRTLEELAAEFNGFEPPLLPRIERVTPQVTPQVIAILQTMVIAKEMSRHELMGTLNLKDRKNFSDSYLVPALKSGLIEMPQPDKPQPDKPNSNRQKYRLTEHGKVARNKARAE